MEKVKTIDMEIAVARHFGIRQNIIIPNISWSYFKHECDILVVTNSGCAYEVEIKVCKYDLIKDKEKKHNHRSPKIKRLYFAIPDYLLEFKEHIPERAGILVLGTNKEDGNYYSIIEKREPVENGRYSFPDKDICNFARLSAMRIWNLKTKVSKHNW